MSIFRKKDVGLAQTEMKRHLTIRDVVLLGIDAAVPVIVKIPVPTMAPIPRRTTSLRVRCRFISV